MEVLSHAKHQAGLLYNCPLSTILVGPGPYTLKRFFYCLVPSVLI